MEKLSHLFLLVAYWLSMGPTTRDIFYRVLGLFIHPFMHRRNLMSIFHRSYKWLHSMEEHLFFRIPPDIVDELLGASLMLPHSFTCTRWPVSHRLSCTDATPQSGGACACRGSRRPGEMLFRVAEQKGQYVRLDWLNRKTRDPDHEGVADPTIGALVRSLPWHVTRSHWFGKSSHVNLQEMREIVEEINELLQY